MATTRPKLVEAIRNNFSQHKNMDELMGFFKDNCADEYKGIDELKQVTIPDTTSFSQANDTGDSSPVNTSYVDMGRFFSDYQEIILKSKPAFDHQEITEAKTQLGDLLVNAYLDYVAFYHFIDHLNTTGPIKNDLHTYIKYYNRSGVYTLKAFSFLQKQVQSSSLPKELQPFFGKIKKKMEQLLWYDYDSLNELLKYITIANLLCQISKNTKLYRDGIAYLTDLTDMEQQDSKTEKPTIDLTKDDPESPDSPADETNVNLTINDLEIIAIQLDQLRADRPFLILINTVPDIKIDQETTDSFVRNKNNLYHHSMRLLTHLYANSDRGGCKSLSEALESSYQYIQDPREAQKPEFVKKVQEQAAKVDGKSIPWRKWLGGFLVVFGVAVGVLGMAGIPFTLGTSALGIKIGWSIATFGSYIIGGTLFKCGQQHPGSVSADLSAIDEAGQRMAKRYCKNN